MTPAIPDRSSSGAKGETGSGKGQHDGRRESREPIGQDAQCRNQSHGRGNDGDPFFVDAGDMSPDMAPRDA